MAYHFKNLVFEGGGVKGIAYVGALEVLDREGILNDIERVAGTSAGAMVAVMVSRTMPLELSLKSLKSSVLSTCITSSAE